jgi:hypothetical protein
VAIEANKITRSLDWFILQTTTTKDTSNIITATSLGNAKMNRALKPYIIKQVG